MIGRCILRLGARPAGAGRAARNLWRLAATLALAAALHLAGPLPAAAWGGGPVGVDGNGERGWTEGFWSRLAAVSERLAGLAPGGLTALWERTGAGMDPNGSPPAQGDTGMGMQPDGSPSAQGDEGMGMDPNG